MVVGTFNSSAWRELIVVILSAIRERVLVSEFGVDCSFAKVSIHTSPCLLVNASLSQLLHASDAKPSKAKDMIL